MDHTPGVMDSYTLFPTVGQGFAPSGNEMPLTGKPGLRTLGATKKSEAIAGIKTVRRQPCDCGRDGHRGETAVSLLYADVGRDADQRGGWNHADPVERVPDRGMTGRVVVDGGGLLHGHVVAALFAPLPVSVGHRLPTQSAPPGPGRAVFPDPPAGGPASVIRTRFHWDGI